MELPKGSLTLYMSPVAQIAVLNVDANIMGYLWPPIIAGYQLEGLEVTCMSSDAYICSTIQCHRSLSLGT
jgi:hypothetical protein